MKKLISTMVMLLVLMFALSTTVQAYTMSFTGKTEVESGETFSVTISVDEPTTSANGYLYYDSSLFTYVGVTQTNMGAQDYPTEGKVQWMYIPPMVENPEKVNSFTFTFKAAEVEETKKGTFTLDDFTVVLTDEISYAQSENTISGQKSVEVTINKKEVKPAEPTWTLKPSNDFELEVGDTKTIETDGDVTWTSSDSKIATVDKNGKVTAVKEGTATITATDKDGNTKSVKVTVVAKDELTLSPSGNIKLEVGETQKVETNKEVTWTTSNSKVATVDKNGKITAVGKGTATITATDEDGNTKTIKVTVTKKDTTSGKKDNTKTPDKTLPQTGEDFTRFACLGLAAVILAAGLVFKKKAKNLSKLFVILPLVAIMSLSGAVNAIKIVDDETMKAGVFAKGELLEDEDVVAISPCKNFTTENTLSVETLESLLNSDTQHIVSVVDSEGNEIDLEATIVPTGAVAWVSPIAGEDEVTTQVSEDYTVLLYGDANGDGKICNCLDVNVIRQDYVFNNKAEGVYKLAADLYADDVLNVRDVQRMVKKYLGTLDGSVVTPFPGEKEIVLDPNDDFDLGKGDSQTITADTEVEWSWDEDSDVADVEVNNDDGSIKVTGKNPGQIDITATDENGNEKTITVTVVSATMTIKDYTQGSITVEAAIEGKEIASVKHMYRTQPGFTQNPYNEWSEVADVTTAEYVYTTKELTDGWPYQFMAEITTTDGKVYETDITSWLMGSVGNAPAIEVTATPNEDDVTIKTEVTNDVDVDQYAYTLQKKNDDGTYSTVGEAVRTTNPEYTFEGLEDGAYQVVVVASTNKGAYTTKFVNFTISTLDEGETLDESEAVARVFSTEKMYTTVQYAINATTPATTSDGMFMSDGIVLLKDTTESIIIPAEKKDLFIDLNGHTLTGDEDEIYTIMSYVDFLDIASYDEENIGKIVRGTTTNTTDENITEVVATNILLKEDSSVCCWENVELELAVNDGANIANLGAGYVGIEGTYLKANAQGTDGIRDLGNGGFVEIIYGTVEGGIKKTNAGEIYIGFKNDELISIDDLDTENQLLITDMTNTIDAGEDTKVYFHNGVLAATYSAGTGQGSSGAATFGSFCTKDFTEIREGHKTIREEKYLYLSPLDEGETLDEAGAIARVASTEKMYTTVQYAVNAAANTDTVIMLNNTTEAVTIPESKNITLNLNGKILTVPESGTAITVNSTSFTMKNEARTQSELSNVGGLGIKVNNTNAEITLEDDIKYNNSVIETVDNFAGKITVNNAEWKAGASPERFIKDNGSGEIVINGGSYIECYVMIEQSGAGTITIGDKKIDICDPESPVPFLEARDAIVSGENSTINFYNGKLSMRSIASLVNTIDGKRDDAFLYSDTSSAYYIPSLLPGETLDESEAVAKLLPANRLFKTVQDATNAIDGSGTVQLLKDVEESFIVPETATGAILDLNGHILTAVNPEYAITNNGNLTIMNSNTSAIGQVTTPLESGFSSEQMHTIITKGNLTITTNDAGTSSTQVNLHPKADDDSTATIKNIGTNNTIKVTGGASIGGSANIKRFLNSAILDENTGSTIIVEKANIGGYIGIKKTGSGTIDIGTNEQELWGTSTGPTDPLKLSVQGTYEALLVDKNVKVNFYNGYLGSSADQVSKNTDGTTHEFDAYRDGFGTTLGMSGSAELDSAYYREPFYTDNGETLNKEEAVAQLMSYPGGYYKTVEGAMQSAIDSGKTNGGTVKLLKSTTESVAQPQGSIFTLDLNGNTLTGEAGKEVTIGVVNGGLTITNSTGEGKVVSAETASVVANISLNNSALTLSPEDGTELRIELKNSGETGDIPNIAKGGSNDIVIKGNTYVVGPDYNASVYSKAIHDDGTGDIKIYSGVISGGTAIEKTSSGTIWIGYDYISGEVAERTELSISGTYGCLNVNEECKVYYYDGYLDVTGVESAHVDNGMVCINEKLDTDNDGYIDSYTVHEFDETRSNDTAVELNGTASSYMTFYSVITTAAVSETGTEALTEVLEAAQ